MARRWTATPVARKPTRAKRVKSSVTEYWWQKDTEATRRSIRRQRWKVIGRKSGSVLIKATSRYRGAGARVSAMRNHQGRGGGWDWLIRRFRRWF